jgi:hypothetical protein
LVRPAPSWDKSEFVYQPHTVQGERGVLAVAVSSNQQVRQDRVILVAVAFFEEGWLIGYQMAGKTLHLSHAPTLALDTLGNLHMAWREGAPVESKVFYATTAPAACAALDRLTAGDIAQVLLRGGLESLASVLLFPVATPWLLSGLLCLGTWVVLRERTSLGEALSWDGRLWVPVGVAVAFYQGAKLFLMPTVASHVPFSAWIYVPGGSALPLRVGVPLAILAAAGAVAATVRRRSRSVVLLYLSLALTDMILTLAIYGVTFSGEF